MAQQSKPPYAVPSRADIDRRPWKYLGWPEFARFAAADDDFFVLRRFDVASARVLLAMQDRVTVLEERLDALDRKYSSVSSDHLNNGSFREEHSAERKDVLRELQSELLEYKQFLWVHSELKAKPSACAQSKRNVIAWLYNHNGALAEPETHFVDAADLVNVVNRKRTPLRSLLEGIPTFRSLPIFRSRQAPPEPTTTVCYSDSRVDNFVNYLLLAFGLLMLIGPLWVLNWLSDIRGRLGFISGSIIIFLLLVSLLTAARPSEALAATAAYSAVLIVFIQIGPS